MKHEDTETTPAQQQAEELDSMSPEPVRSNDPAEVVGTDENTVQYFPVSEGKLITLYILSFGLYGVYWFYKNWTLQQPRLDKKIFPVMRAVFSIFFTHSLFKLISQSAANLDRKHRFNANLMATIFVAAVVISNILDRVSVNSGMPDTLSDNTMIVISLIIFLLSSYPLVAVQATVNRLNNDILGFLNHRYSAWNYLLIITGGLLWLMLLLGLLADSMGLVPAH